jgi:hypothetical protein
VAIAFDSSVDGGNNGGTTNSRTYAFDNVAGNLVLVGVVGDTPGGGHDDVTGVTYNAVSMTQVQKSASSLLNRFIYLYILQNAPTGNNNVVVSCTNNHYLISGAVSYSGCSTTGQPDNSNVNVDGSTNNTYTTSLTPTANNCWVICFAGCYQSNNQPPNAGAGATVRVTDGAFGTWGFFDSNAAESGGVSYSEAVNWNSSGAVASQGHIMASLKPPGVAAAGLFRAVEMSTGGLGGGGPFFGNPIGYTPRRRRPDHVRPGA